MNVIVYKIRLNNGSFSNGGVNPKNNNSVGKIWKTRAHLKLHFLEIINRYSEEEDPIKCRYPNGFTIIVYDLIENNRISSDKILGYIDGGV